jgi:hypothetical protein
LMVLTKVPNTVLSSSPPELLEPLAKPRGK